MLPNLIHTAYLSGGVCVHARITFFHYYDSTCSSKAIHSIRNTTPPSSSPCAWLGLSATAHSPLIAGLTVTTPLHTSGLHTERRKIGENTEAGTQLTYRAIDNLLPSQQNCTEEASEPGGRGERGGGGEEGKKENPEHSSLANVVKPSSQSSFAREQQRRKRTLNEKSKKGL